MDVLHPVASLSWKKCPYLVVSTASLVVNKYTSVMY